MTEGLDTTPGTASSVIRGHMGGGAVGFELDSINGQIWHPAQRPRRRQGNRHSPEDYGWVNEDMLTHPPSPPAGADWSCADMTFFETPSGAAPSSPSGR